MCVPEWVCACECMLVEARNPMEKSYGSYGAWSLEAVVSHPKGALGAELSQVFYRSINACNS